MADTEGGYRGMFNKWLKNSFSQLYLGILIVNSAYSLASKIFVFKKITNHPMQLQFSEFKLRDHDKCKKGSDS